MNVGEVESLIQRGETYVVEFKARLNDDDLVEAVVCLANGDGGVLLVGVENDGSLVGAKPRHGDGTKPDRVAALVAGRTLPPLEVAVSMHVVNGFDVLAIEVPKATSLVGTAQGKYVRRAIGVDGAPQCLPLQPNEMLDRLSSLRQVDITAMEVARATWGDLDRIEIGRFRELARRTGDSALGDLSDPDLVAALGLITPAGVLRVGAILMFGTEDSIDQFVPTHEVVFQVLERQQVLINRSQRTPLIRSMTDLVSWIAPYNPEEEIEVGLLRVGLPRWSEQAIRETIANALVHRSYAKRGSTRVLIEDGVLSVQSEGPFPDGVTLTNLLNVPPHPRNPLIADAFKRAGLVEKTGRGINRAFAGQLGLGRPAPDYSRSTNQWVDVQLRAGPADRELAAYIAQLGRNDQVDLRYLQVLHEVRAERRLTTARVAELLQTSDAEARSELNRLVERGLLEARGEGRSRTYHLAAGIYRQLGEETAYVRTRGVDALQQEQMVLTYVERYGSIDRARAAELCTLEPRQASSLLRRLVESGRLQMRGERRGAHYVLGDTTE